MSQSPADTTFGRIMALDLGEKRIGVAVSDAGQMIAGAHGVVQRKSRAADFERFAAIAEELAAVMLVMGLPITMAGHEGDRAAWVRDYAADLAAHLQLPVEFWDERLTTKQAEATLRQLGRKGKKIKQNVDAVAATLILQSFLDDRRPAPEMPLPYDDEF